MSVPDFEKMAFDAMSMTGTTPIELARHAYLKGLEKAKGIVHDSRLRYGLDTEVGGVDAATIYAILRHSTDAIQSAIEEASK